MNGASKKILVIDDEPDFVKTVVDYLKSSGYDVSAAHNLEDAVKTFRRERPKLILLDFNMPMVTGEKFLPVLQGLDPSLKVIVITGYLVDQVEEKFKGLGYFAFFEKAGLSLEKLKEKVKEALA